MQHCKILNLLQRQITVSQLTKPSITLFIFYYLFKEQNYVVTWENFAEKTFKYNLPFPIT